MKNENLLTRTEMKIIVGGFPIQALFDNCISEATAGETPGTDEYEILYRLCENMAENMCAREIAMGRECWLNT